MHPPLPAHDPHAVEREVQSARQEMFTASGRTGIERVFGWATDCFTGRHPKYEAIDAPYHDFEHTLQGTLCLGRLLRGRHRAGAQPAMTERMFELAITAMLFHDTGYLKTRDDRDGSGAKHTDTHVERGLQLIRDLLSGHGYAAGDIQAVENMILCTEFDRPLSGIRFQSALERTAGFALGTADLLGQMAGDDYVEKLPKLFSEFQEAARHSSAGQSLLAKYRSAEELVRNTPVFWETFVQPKLNGDFGGLYRFLNDPYPHGPNEYLDRIRANMEKARQKV